MRTAALTACCLLVLVAPLGAVEEDETRVPETEVVEPRAFRGVESLTGRADTLPREELDLRDAWTLEEALSEAPGVDIVGAARYGQEVRVNVRGVPSGFGTQRALVMLDGRPLTDEFTGHVDLVQYPIFAMERIELVRGPASSAYGTNAIGGVLNLVPRRGGPEPETEIVGEGGTFGTWRLAAAHGRRFGAVDAFAAVERTETNGYLENSRGDDIDWEATNGFLNVGWRGDRLEVRTYLGFFEGEGTDEDSDKDLDRDLQDLTVTWDADPARDAVTRVRLYRSALDQTLEWFDRPEADFDTVSTGAIVTQTWRVAGDHLLTGGVEYRRESADVDDGVAPVDESVTTWSLFVEDAISATDDVDVVVGLRYDDREEVDGELSWRAGANWRVTDETTLRGAFGKAFRAPTISDQFLPPVQSFGLTFRGNPDLDPETLHSAEVGVDHELTDDAVLGATVFGSRFRDFFDFILDEGTGVFETRNIARVEIYGLETTLGVDLGCGFRADLAYTYTNAEYEEFDLRPDAEGNRLDDNVRHRGAATLSWRHEDGHAARLGVDVSGDRYTDERNTREGHLDGYYVVFLQAEAAVTPWASLTLNVENLFNHRYAVRPEFKQPGRAIFGGLRLRF